MAAYVIVLVQVNDAIEYAKYAALSGPLVEQFGGRFLVRGGAAESMEGPDFDRRMVIVELPDSETARRFYDSDEYRAACAIRTPASDASSSLWTEPEAVLYVATDQRHHVSSVPGTNPAVALAPLWYRAFCSTFSPTRERPTWLAKTKVGVRPRLPPPNPQKKSVRRRETRRPASSFQEYSARCTSHHLALEQQRFQRTDS